MGALHDKYEIADECDISIEHILLHLDGALEALNERVDIEQARHDVITACQICAALIERSENKGEHNGTEAS